MSHTGVIATWLMIFLLVGLNSAGDMFTAKAMRRVGDFSELRRRAGISGVVRAVLTEPWFFIGLLAMALSTVVNRAERRDSRIGLHDLPAKPLRRQVHPERTCQPQAMVVWDAGAWGNRTAENLNSRPDVRIRPTA